MQPVHWEYLLKKATQLRETARLHIAADRGDLAATLSRIADEFEAKAKTLRDEEQNGDPEPVDGPHDTATH